MALRYVEYYETVVPRSSTAEERADPAQLPEGAALERTKRGQKFFPKVITPRSRGVKVARIKVVRPGAGDAFYIRQLLLHRAASSWADLRTTVDNDGFRTVHATFQEAAIALGILEGANEAYLTVNEAAENFATAHEHRFLFCLLIVDGAPAVGLWDSFRDHMSRDFLPLGLNAQPSEAAKILARSAAMQKIAIVVDGMGKTPADFGLDYDEPRAAEADADRAFFSGRHVSLAVAAARARQSFTAAQSQLYEDLLSAASGGTGNKLHLIQRRAGRGKTFVIKAVIDQLRASLKVLAVSGATGLSASAFDRGSTVHKMFEIPVQDQLDAIPLISAITPEGNNRRAAFLRTCSAIVIDEIWALHRSVIEAVDAVMRRIIQNELPFGGKAVFAIGDPRQTAPIVPGAGRPQILDHSFLASPLFNSFQLHELEQSMRNGEDPDFSTWVDVVGDDWNGAAIDVSSFFATTTSVEQARQFLFPPHVTQDVTLAAKRAFLSPYNKDVDSFNNAILESLPGEASKYQSFDSVRGDVELGQEAMASPDYLNDLNFPGIPAHELQLKPRTLCVLMRNMSSTKGMVKNAKVEVLQCGRRFVSVRLLASGETYKLPRINFEFQPPYFPFKIIRKQVPLRLAYALTFHGCQGATLDRTVIDCRLPVFSHGQRYASISRCRHKSHTVALLAEPESVLEEGELGTRAVNNIVYKEFVEARPLPEELELE
ncbi:hypothetical protein A4X09_0g7008 [Tilletia walkeri]|uniref:ATP-dependent DNA helicase n=1 Tax=Tilletia walkeri TaxID=117179 RepID=A0A8X7N3Y1_9BASI|nr:hypothetical protein A4X09_0g7008 [Tilletia walkeri]